MLIYLSGPTSHPYLNIRAALHHSHQSFTPMNVNLAFVYGSVYQLNIALRPGRNRLLSRGGEGRREERAGSRAHGANHPHESSALLRLVSITLSYKLVFHYICLLGLRLRQYRYKIILAIGWPLDLERELMDELAVKYLKNYQVWHHRRLLLTALKTQLEAINTSSSAPSPNLMKVDVDPGSNPVRVAAQYELDFIARGLQEDTKNYHTWAYRQFILTYFGDEDLWKGELPWVEDLLREDVRNNSAWHHRFFVVFASGVRKGDEDRGAVLKQELQ
jgi:hypothetical protein